MPLTRDYWRYFQKTPMGSAMFRLLPPFLFLISAGLMLAANYLIPLARLPAGNYQWLGVLFIAGGLAISAWHSRLFRQVGTNIHTFEEPGKLVTAGLFSVSRNPMYLGFVLALLGLALFLGSASAMLIALAFMIVTDRWYIAFEERAMLEKFGNDYIAYKRRVRRWI